MKPLKVLSYIYKKESEWFIMFDYLVVGAGLYGAIFAHEAKTHGKSVLVVDKRPNIAGNIYTEKIEGINVHKCIFRKNCASVPEERSAIPLQAEQSSAGWLVTIGYSAIPAGKFKAICLGCHSA